MRIAIIDLGANSVRFDVFQIGADGRAQRLHREKFMVRLGQNVFLSGRLHRGAMERTLEAFVNFKRAMDEFHVHRVAAFGTSALRAAEDGDAFVRRVLERTGIEIKIISGEEEARLIARGVLAHKRVPEGRFALLDIGGGSAELSLCREGKLIQSVSFNLGAVRLQEVFLKTVPPRRAAPGETDSVERLRQHIRQLVKPVLKSDGWPDVKEILGSGGTIRALAKLGRTDRKMKSLSREELKEWVKFMRDLSAAQLQRIPGMDPGRADILFAGAVLLEEIVKLLGAETVTATNFSLRDGILEKELKALRGRETASQGFDLDDVCRKVKPLGVHEEHIEKVLGTGDQLFTKCRALHRLRPEWKKFLQAAALFLPIGKNIDHAHHEMHSSYVAKNAYFPLMAPWENALIGELCRWQKGGRAEEIHPAVPPGKVGKTVFLKLLALLRLFDALDRRYGPPVVIERVILRKKAVEMRISHRQKDVTLEILRVEQKKALFESVFKKTLIVRKSSAR